jgi:hypothetical protein
MIAWHCLVKEKERRPSSALEYSSKMTECSYASTVWNRTLARSFGIPLHTNIIGNRFIIIREYTFLSILAPSEHVVTALWHGTENTWDYLITSLLPMSLGDMYGWLE